MDTLTHALSGALIARATAPRDAAHALPLARRVGIGFLAATFPDLDVVTSLVSPLAYLYHHRGVTHSVLLLPLWTVLLAWLCSIAWRRDRPWRAYAGVIAWGIGIHIAGDWITSFGTMIFAPLSDARHALSATFIIDLWFTGIIVAGLVASMLVRGSRLPAVLGLAVLSGYVGFQVVLQQRAIAFGERHATLAGVAKPRVTALPRPVSPFNWMVIVEDDAAYRYAHVNLVRERAPPEPGAGTGFLGRLDSAYRPLDDARWITRGRFGNAPEETAFAKAAFDEPALAFFRWFARYPVLMRIDRGDSADCVWFEDLRFLTPGRAVWPFRYGLCRAGGQWRPYEFMGENVRVPVH